MTARHRASASLAVAATEMAAYRPTSPADLAWLLRTLHDGITGALDDQTEALAAWAGHAKTEHWADGEEIADWLDQAASYLGSAAESLDRARHATGHWHDTGEQTR